MKNAQPVKLYGLQFFYNISQVALCSYMCIEAAIQAYRNVSPLSTLILLLILSHFPPFFFQVKNNSIAPLTFSFC